VAEASISAGNGQRVRAGARLSRDGDRQRGRAARRDRIGAECGTGARWQAGDAQIDRATAIHGRDGNSVGAAG